MKRIPIIFRRESPIPVGLSSSLDTWTRDELIREIQARKKNETKLKESVDQQMHLLQELEIHQLELEIQNREVQKNFHEMEEMNKKYIELYDFAPVGFLTVTSKGKITELNLTAAKMLGIEKSEALKHNFGKYITSGSRLTFDEHLKERCTSDKKTLICELDVKDGPTLHLHSTIETSTQVIKIALVDASEKIRAQVAENKAFELNEEKLIREKYMTEITHDIRTPLTSSRLCAQLLDGAMDDINKKKNLYKLLITELDRADIMIREILDVSKMKGGDLLPLIMRRCNLATISETCIKNITQLHSTVSINYRCDGSVIGKWSKDGLQRIIENLLTNAIKYGSSTDPITLVLSDEGKSVNITVHNYGDPISARDQKKIFEAFHRTASAERSAAPGWGLGLSLVHNIVQRHHGTISVKSNSAEGTSFIINLPKENA
jgi:PAS domain S-box-containing protein